jgi:DNA repair protein RadA/Sms
MKTQFVCSSCGTVYNKWAGHCLSCNSWNSIEEEVIEKTKHKNDIKVSVTKISDIDFVDNDERIVSDFSEINRVLGGGIVRGASILLGGEPGIGKSTLLLQLSSGLCDLSYKVLYISGEESIKQIKLRAERLNAGKSSLMLASITNLAEILSAISKGYDLVIIDSIQTIYSDALGSAPGTVSQIRTCSHEISSMCKKSNTSLIFVGHVTKEGEIAGPKLLEHMVDAVMYFESGQVHGNFRIVRSIKNRFGEVNEIAVFEMKQHGLLEITNPSEIFLQNRGAKISGSAIFAALEGSRPLLIEIQALVSKSNMPMPRRSVVGADPNRLSMLIAVLSTRYGINLSHYDVYLSVTGGLKIVEPAADLAIVAALISAINEKPLRYDSVFFGEIGLAGEIRKVMQKDLRIKEAEKLGFEKIFCPSQGGDDLQSKDSLIVEMSHILELKNLI